MAIPPPKSKRNRIIFIAAGGLLAACCLAGAAAMALTTAEDSGLPADPVWTQVTRPAGERISHVACPTPAICHATSEGSSSLALLSSLNGGKTWTTRPLPAAGPVTSWACPSTTTCYGTWNDQDLYQTDDGGHTWTQSENFPAVQGLDAACPSPTTCYVLGQPSQQDVVVAGTTDGGATWQIIADFSDMGDTGNIEIVGLDCPSAELCLAVGGDNSTPYVYSIPTDGSGPAQVQLTANILQVNSPLSAISCVLSTVCYAVGRDDATQSLAGSSLPGLILKSTNAGNTWAVQMSQAATRFVDISCLAETVCAAIGQAENSTQSQAVVVTADGGDSWHVDIESQQGPWAGRITDDLLGVSCSTAPNCVVVGASGLIVRFGP